MIAIIDYGRGNLSSVQKAFAYLGYNAVVTGDANIIRQADKVVLPGVGAFGDAMQSLKDLGLVDIIYETINNGKPFLGICIGMQLLFESSEETQGVAGLGIIKGRIKKLAGKGIKIPQIGWNALEISKDTKLFDGLKSGDYVYFVHSYYPQMDEDVSIAKIEYGSKIDIALEKNNIYATQFHPEKSGDIGLKILDNFAKG